MQFFKGNQSFFTLIVILILSIINVIIVGYSIHSIRTSNNSHDRSLSYVQNLNYGSLFVNALMIVLGFALTYFMTSSRSKHTSFNGPVVQHSNIHRLSSSPPPSPPLPAGAYRPHSSAAANRSSEYTYQQGQPVDDDTPLYL